MLDRSHCAWALSRLRTSCPGVPHVIMTSRLQGNRDARRRRDRRYWDGWRKGRRRGWNSSGRSSRNGRREKWIRTNHQRTARTWWYLLHKWSVDICLVSLEMHIVHLWVMIMIRKIVGESLDNVGNILSYITNVRERDTITPRRMSKKIISRGA